MDTTETITLVPVIYEEDALKQKVPRELPGHELFCSVESITQSEWAAAGKQGLNAAYKVIVYTDEYGGEEIAVLDGIRYKVYRTYRRKDDKTELYLERRVGI